VRLFFVWIYRQLISLRFAVLLIVAIAASLASGTLLESYYDTRTASHIVYRSPWFQLLLLTLGLCILFVALSRLPWKKRHLPFLLAHLGILILLFGSWLTQKKGLDGQLRVTEGETASSVDFESELLAVSDDQEVKVFNVPWAPPFSHLSPYEIREYGLTVEDFLTHADQIYHFGPADPGSIAKTAPAIHLRLKGGPMQIQQDFWLWAGDPAWSIAPMGPARFVLLTPDFPEVPPQPGEAVFTVRALGTKVKSEGIDYRAVSRRGEVKTGRLPENKVQGAVIDPGWMGLTLTVLEYIPQAVNLTTYKRSKTQYGERAPPSALRVRATNAPAGSGTWLGLGEQSQIQVGSRFLRVQYTNRRVVLPFAIKLEHFQVGHDPGTQNPSSYSSLVNVMGEHSTDKPVLIEMNEPLKWGGYIFYQASYVPEIPRPVTSILSVNYDPGRALKYIGSILIVLGSILLFASKKLRGIKKEASV